MKWYEPSPGEGVAEKQRLRVKSATLHWNHRCAVFEQTLGKDKGKCKFI